MIKNRLAILGSLMLSIMVFLSLAGQASASGADIHEERVDGYTVKLEFPAGEAHRGLNDVTIGLIDANGRPLSGVAVTIATEQHTKEMVMGGGTSSGMDMGGNSATGHSEMAAMKPGTSPGHYAGQVDFGDGGDWMVVVAFTIEGKERSVSIPVDLPNSGPNMLVIGGFLALIAVVVIVAAARRKKAAAVTVPAKGE
ncbi:MAG: hypothetical protein Q7T05_06705 [Dehalococcoidia bacterium]|nr:hypothetical protein [Dehalococcoidia bacterium]